MSNEHPVYPRRLDKNRNITEYNATSATLPHPAVRKMKHVRWLVRHFGGGVVCDPFTGSGTTALACKSLGIPFIGIEIEERFCELAANRLRQEVLDLQEVAV